MKKIILLLLLVISSSIFAAPIEKLVFFGDSLSDNGNLYKSFFKFLPKSPPYFQGRFSNGPTWAENVSDYYYKKYYIDSVNYAVGGATTIYHNPTTKFAAPMTLEFEIYEYLFDSAFKNKNKVLYSIWIGGNDYLFYQKENEKVLTQKIVNKISWAIKKLIEHGGRNFLILNLPDLSKIPFAKNNGSIDRLSILSSLHNQKLAEEVKKLKAAYPDVKIMFINIYDVLNDVIADPKKYNQKYHINITDTTNACWQGGYTIKNLSPEGLKKELQQTTLQDKNISNQIDAKQVSDFILSSPDIMQAYMVGKAYEQGLTPCSNANEHLFWDDIHPSSIVHQILAQAILENLTD